MLLVEGELESNTEYCPLCNSKMHIHDTFEQDLRHLPIGSTLITIRLKRKRYICPYCHCYKMQEAEFIAKGHRITKELYEFIMRKLADGLTNTEISELTGLNRNTIKAIDLKRLKEKYTVSVNSPII